MARRYTRDARGRFSSGGGGGSRGGGSKPIQRGTNRLTRDNAGRITSQGGNGATARGGRLATASGKKRATQTNRIVGGKPAGTVGKVSGGKPKAMSQQQVRDLALGALTPKPSVKPARQRKVDYTGAIKLLNQQQSAIKRLRQPQQTFGGHASHGRALDLRTARNSPMANAQLGIRAARGDYRRAQATTKNPWASDEQRQRAAASLPKLRQKVVAAARTARAFKPQYADETRRRYQAKVK